MPKVPSHAPKEPSLDEQFGQFLARERDAHSLTLRALAAQSGLRHGKIHRLMSGDRGASLRAVETVMQTMGVTLADLFPDAVSKLTPEEIRRARRLAGGKQKSAESGQEKPS